MPLSHCLILIHGLLGNLISFCAFTPQPSYSFLSFCFLFSYMKGFHFYAIPWVCETFPALLHFSSPFLPHPQLRLWPMLAIHLHHISSGLYAMDTIRSLFHKFFPKNRYVSKGVQLSFTSLWCRLQKRYTSKLA